MKRFLLLFLIFATIRLGAADNHKVFPYTYDQHDFPNGLRLVTVPTAFPNVVALWIVVQVGSRNEVEPGKSGFAHLFEHLMFRGTKRFPTEKYEAVLKTAGAASNAYTSDDITVYHTTFSKEDLESILEMEADRFQNVEYDVAAFKTETLAVLGEYNKNSAFPQEKLDEVSRDTAFARHTYKHSTMGFLKDVKDMPNQFAYSRQFFDRYYRPEYTTIVVVGDVKPEPTRQLVDKHWSQWEHGEYKAQIPVEPAAAGPRTAQVNWPSPTLPWVVIAYRNSAYSDAEKDQATLDIIESIGFSESSPLYKKLVIEEQKVDTLASENPDRVDPFLFTVLARLKNASDMPYVRDEILATFRKFADQPIAAERLEAVKSHVRYGFALELNSSEAIADTLAHFVGLRRSPETINRVFDLYSQITPDDVMRVARKYFTENGRTVVTLQGGAAK